MLLQLVEPGTTPQPHNDKEEIAIGIDLGTTNSVVALIVAGKPFTIPVEGHSLVPSVVSYEQENARVIVGREALGKEDKNTISSFKRHMHQPAKPLFRDKSPVELSAEVLRFLKNKAESFLGEEISKAVITVPAYFDDTARQATKDAAKLAGLSVLRLINEPTAAALSYGLDQGAEGIYAIYDFGGGTFDVSLLNLTQGVFQVLATGGDTQLGGDDIDLLITNKWLKDFDTLVETRDLLWLARQAKESLSTQEVWEGRFKSVVLSLSANELDALIVPLIKKTILVCKRVLSDANLDRKAIKGVVLVGGSTRLNAVRKAVENFFGREPLVDLDPDQVVALGAALQANALVYGSDTLLVDVNPLSLGIETMGGLVEKIVLRNNPIPVSMAQEFTTYQDGQTAMKIHVLQGERELVADCRSLAEFTLHGIPPMAAGAARIQVTFNLDADGLLTVSAKEKITGQIQEIEVKPSYGLTDADLKSMLFQSFESAGTDMEKRLLVESIVEAEQLIQYLQTALKTDSHLLESDESSSLQEGIQKIKTAIDEKNREKIKMYSKELSNKSQTFAERRITYALRQHLVGQTISQD